MAIQITITVKDKKKRSSAGEKLFTRKPNAKGKHLIIVESPAKAKTIERILGSDYKVLASMGHLRDLPQRTLGVDVENDFKPEYVNSAERADVIENLQKEANKSKDILLATDPDREGEAISWHLSKLLDVDPRSNARIAFHEITPPAIKEAVLHPEPIDLNRVDAQQARRVLDRLVGYKLSPWLWKQVYRGLSAGRVQSVATRLICEREEEIRAFKPVEYWTVEGIYRTEEKESFKAKLTQVDGKEAKIHNAEEADRVVRGILKQPAEITSVTKTKKQRKAKPPYTTSTMQQDAVNRLNFGSKKTMALAQMLYEGIEIPGHGHVGLITYMRTDSTRISDEMIKQVRPYIERVYGKDYLPPKPNVYARGKDSQDAHEAIRPSSVMRTPDSIASYLTKDQLKLYTLIWSRFVASQMSAAIYDTVQVELEQNQQVFKANGSTIKFAGYQKVYQDNSDSKKSNVLPELVEGDKVSVQKLDPEQHFTQPPARYSEATLIKTLEEIGVGRPSTYAPTIETIQKRYYVKLVAKRFEPTELGEIVHQMINNYFPNIVDTHFTAEMESELDQIEAGKQEWVQVIDRFYQPFKAEVDKAEIQIEKVQIKDEPAGFNCEVCGSPMVIKLGRFGKFYACSNFPDCRHTAAIVKEIGVTCPHCHQGHVIERKSKKNRLFYGCDRYPECEFVSWDKPVGRECPKCSHYLVEKKVKSGKQIVCSQCDYKEEIQK